MRPMCTILGAAMYYLLLDYVVCNTMIWIKLLLLLCMHIYAILS